MTSTSVEFDPFSAEYFDDPLEVYRRLRDEAPVYFNAQYGFYALSRFEDVLPAHCDWAGLLERARRRPVENVAGYSNVPVTAVR